MIEIRRRVLVIIAVALMFVGMGTAYAQQIDGGESGGYLDPFEGGPEIGPGPAPRPGPEPPQEPATTTFTTFQLVGFTTLSFAGDKGILNLARECQKEFKSSRMCTVNEINQTVIVPRPATYSHVWVYKENAPASAPPSGTVSTNCEDWTTTLPTVFGTTTEVGPESGCFGGFFSRGCHEHHAIACCSRIVPQDLIP